MESFLKISAAILFLTFANTSSADWTVPSKVNFFYVKGSGDVLVKMYDMSVDDSPECKSGNNPGYYSLQESANANFEELFSVLLAAHSGENLVRFYLIGCDGDHPKIAYGYSRKP